MVWKKIGKDAYLPNKSGHIEDKILKQKLKLVSKIFIQLWRKQEIFSN
jgi:hypothetical protein